MFNLNSDKSANEFYLVRPMMRPTLGLPLPMPRGGPMDQPYRFPPQGPVLLPGGPPGAMARGPMQIQLGHRGPMPGNPMVLGRMPGPPPSGVHPSQSVVVMQRPGVPQVPNESMQMHPSLQPRGPGCLKKNIFIELIFTFMFKEYRDQQARWVLCQVKTHKVITNHHQHKAYVTLSEN